MSDNKPAIKRVAICIVLCISLFIAVVSAITWLNPSKPKPAKDSWIDRPVVNLSIDVFGGTKQGYSCYDYFRLGDPPKSLEFTGLPDVSILVSKAGRRTAVLQLITGARTIEIEVGTKTQEIVLDDKRRIRLGFSSCTLPPFDDRILLSDTIEVFRHYHVVPIEGGNVVPPGMTKEQLRSKLIALVQKMLTEPHGGEGFDGRGDGYEIDVTIDGRPMHISMTFVSGWIVIKDEHDTRYYGFHPDRLRKLHVALDQYVAMESEQQSRNSLPTR